MRGRGGGRGGGVRFVRPEGEGPESSFVRRKKGSEREGGSRGEKKANSDDDDDRRRATASEKASERADTSDADVREKGNRNGIPYRTGPDPSTQEGNPGAKPEGRGKTQRKAEGREGVVVSVD